MFLNLFYPQVINNQVALAYLRVDYLIKIGINNSTATKMLKGEAVQLNFRQLSALCVNLNCTPNDLLALRQMHLADNHQLLQLQKVEDEIENPYSFFEGKSVAEIKAFLKEQ